MDFESFASDFTLGSLVSFHLQMVPRWGHSSRFVCCLVFARLALMTRCKMFKRISRMRGDEGGGMFCGDLRMIEMFAILGPVSVSFPEFSAWRLYTLHFIRGALSVRASSLAAASMFCLIPIPGSWMPTCFLSTFASLVAEGRGPECGAGLRATTRSRPTGHNAEQARGPERGGEKRRRREEEH